MSECKVKDRADRPFSKRGSMGKRLGLKLDMNEEESKDEHSMEASFVTGANGHLTKRSRNGDIVVRSRNAGRITVTKAGGIVGKVKDQPEIVGEDLRVHSVLGRGASSHVDLVKHIPSGRMMALKVMNVFDKGRRSQIVEEITALYTASCPALVDFYGVYFEEGSVSVALEYMDQGCLGTVLQKYGRVPEPVLAAIAFQTLWGLGYLKVEKRVHRDIKPQNILVNTQGQVKLTDFGISKELENSIGMCMTFVGTFKYMSPERIQSKPYSYASDIWSLGLVLLECGTGVYPFPDCNTYIEMVQTVIEVNLPDIARLTSSRKYGFSSEFQEFINCCIQSNPRDRVPAAILLGSPWLASSGIKNVKDAATIVRRWLRGQGESESVRGEAMDVDTEGKVSCESKMAGMSLGGARKHK